jgi:type IV secretory pathway VirB6-like protein
MKHITNNIFKFLFAFVLTITLLNNNNVFAGNSCITNTISVTEIIKNLVTGQGILGDMLGNIQSHVDMTTPEGDYCRIPSNNIKFNVNQGFALSEWMIPSSINNPQMSENLGSGKIYVTYPGDLTQLLAVLVNPTSLASSIMKISTYETADKICLQAINPGLSIITSWIVNLNTTIGCKYRPDQQQQGFNTFFPTSTNQNTVYYKASNKLHKNTQQGNDVFISVFYPVVKTIDYLTDSLFFNSNNQNSTLSHLIRDFFKTFVVAMITISVIIFGMKLALGAAAKKNEIMLFIIKLVLVISFCFGIGFPNLSNEKNVTQLNGTQFIQSFFKNVTTGLSAIGSNTPIENSSNKNTSGSKFTTQANWLQLCNITEKSSYLTIFYKVDCRIGYYLGLNLYNLKDSVSFLNDNKSSFLSLPSLSSISISLLFLVLSLCFILLIISVFISVVHVYCISLIIQTLLIILAPLIIPCCLFQYTKGFFDKWVQLILAYSIQPMIFLVTLSLMCATFDVITIGDCDFIIKNVTVNEPVSSPNDTPITHQVNKLLLQNYPKSKTCKYSLLYRFQQLQQSNSITYHDTFASLVNLTKISDEFTNLILPPLIAITLCSLIFYLILGQLANLAAELSAGPTLEKMAISPTKFIESLYKLGKKIYDSQNKKKPEEDAEVNENENPDQSDGSGSQARSNPTGRGSGGGGGQGGNSGGSGDGGSGSAAQNALEGSGPQRGGASGSTASRGSGATAEGAEAEAGPAAAVVGAVLAASAAAKEAEKIAKQSESASSHTDDKERLDGESEGNYKPSEAAQEAAQEVADAVSEKKDDDVDDGTGGTSLSSIKNDSD